MRTLPSALAAGAIGIALGLALSMLRPGGERPEEAPPEPVPQAEETRALEAALAEERAARARLEAELAALRRALAPDPEGAEEAPPAPAPVAAAAGAAGRERFDPSALEALGYASTDIDRLRERSDQLELDELYLHNEARREEWLRRPRYQNELRALRDEVIEDVGYDGYDAIRYARGEKNRVVVARLLPGSPAVGAGLQAGDGLLSYGGQRILDPRGIADATASGTAGELTEVRIEREGEELRFFLPRGPIGVQLGRERRAPPTR